MSVIPAGYKKTEVGVIPEDWELRQLKVISPSQSVGLVINPSTYVEDNGTVPMLLGSNIEPNRINWEQARRISNASNKKIPASQLSAGDLVTVRVGAPGITAVVPQELDGCNCASVMIVRKHKSFNSHWLCYVMNSRTGLVQIENVQYGTAQKQFNISDAINFAYATPPLHEQDAIAEALNDADALIESLEQLLTKKRHLKQAAMQELLTGKKRLPGFSGGWAEKRIADIASPISEKNSAGESLTVLTCSKHLGFVDSLGYFKNQVFSRDTSGYKIIRRGQIGYPANHIEEGSIGLQDCYDAALVSPIYVVFSVSDQVDSYFLHRLLKLDSFRQKFETATSSSVDRRGSLRWPAFSAITVCLPAVAEQQAIKFVLSTMESEIADLEAQLAKTRALKQGMMQNLLTGEIRLI